MARTTLTPVALTGNGAVLNNAGTSIDQTNGMNIPVASNTIPASGNVDRMVLYVTNSYAGTVTVTVHAGANTTNDPQGPAFESGKGDLVTGTLTASTGSAFIGPFEVARFVQADGSLNVDFSASAAGKIWAIQLPRAF